MLSQRSGLLSRTAVFSEPLAPWCGVAASVTLAGVDLLLAFITPEYNAISETISEMHGTDKAYSTIARLSLLAYCGLAVPFTLRALLLPEIGGPWVRFMAFGLWVHVVMGVITAAFQTDSLLVIIFGFTANDIHDGAGYVMYVAGIVGVVGAAMAMDHGPSTKWLHLVSVAVATVMITAGLIYATSVADEYTGVKERIGFAAYLLWVALMSLRIGAARPLRPLRLDCHPVSEDVPGRLSGHPKMRKEYLVRVLDWFNRYLA